MVNGKLSCLGSPQHLKHRFGNGFEINIRTKTAKKEDIMKLFDILKIRIDLFANNSNFRNFIINKTITNIFLDNWKYELSFLSLTKSDN
jgi:hypothetical protein